MLFYNILIPLVLTILIEFVIIWLFLKENPLRILFYSAIINCLTLPLATYGYNYIKSNMLLIEILVVFAESLLIMFLFKLKYQKALLISAAANVVTAFVGVIIF